MELLVVLCDRRGIVEDGCDLRRGINMKIKSED
jgi:hypothetical protein